MKQTVSIAPPHSIVNLTESGTGQVPDMEDMSKPAWGTPTCIIVRCRPEVDGPTQVVFGDRVDVDPGRNPDFAGILKTPRRTVMMTEVGDELILKMPVSADLTLVSIWVSHPQWPESIIIGLG